MISANGTNRRQRKPRMRSHRGDFKLLAQGDKQLEQARKDMHVLVRVPKISGPSELLETLMLGCQFGADFRSAHPAREPALPQRPDKLSIAVD
jgi:hypothetical protein